MREEEVGLRGAGAAGGAGEVVAPAFEAGGGGAVVVRGEAGVDVGGAFGGLVGEFWLGILSGVGGCLDWGETGVGKGMSGWVRYLDDDEAGTAVVCALEVDVALVVGDVETLDGGTLVDGRFRRKRKGQCLVDGHGRDGREELHDD